MRTLLRGIICILTILSATTSKAVVCHTEFTYAAGSNPDSIIFTAHGSVGVQYLWTFGDGTTSTSSSPSHVYSQPGTYNVCVAIVTATGDSCDWCGTVVVHTAPPCHVEFTYTAGMNPDSIIFTPVGSPVVSYFWNFGDGTTSTSSNPSHVYAGPGTYNVCVIAVTANGDSCDWCHIVEVHAPPHNCHVEFTYTAGTNPDSIIFTPVGSPVVSYFWNFGDGTTSTSSNPSHVYAGPGTYNVCVIAVTANGDSCDWCHIVEVHAPPHNCHVEFTYTAGTNPDSIIFTPVGSPVVSYFWNFGDGTTSTASNPSHVYAGPGTYNVCVIAVTASGDSCDWCHIVEVHAPPHNCHVEFTYTAGTNPDSIIFTPVGSPVVSYFWNFGDGTTSTSSNPSHVYAGPGTYNVCVIAVTANGDSCDWCHIVELHAPPHNCHVEFTYTAGTNPDSIIFTPVGSPVVSYFWNFGDGTTSTASNPSHVYSGPGTFNVCVIAVTANGDSCDWCHIVEVHAPPHNCHVEFTYTAGTNPDSIIFTPVGSPVVSYFWNFGDGTTSTSSNPSHVYAGPGTYNVCVIAVTASGDSCDWCHIVEVHAPPHNCHVEFTYTAGTNPDSIIFTPVGSPVVSYLWNFGDGTTSTASNPSHVYAGPGTYNVCVIAVTANGDSCDWCHIVEVHAPPHNCHVEFTYTAGTNPDSIIFTPVGSPVVSYLWNFGDGTTSTASNPSHVYAGPGTYNVCVIAVTANGDSCDWCHLVEVHAPPHNCHVEFTWSVTSNPDSFVFTAVGTQAVAYLWNFGDGTTSTLPNPSHVFAAGGNFNVCLTIVTAAGDSCDWCHPITTGPQIIHPTVEVISNHSLNRLILRFEELSSVSTLSISNVAGQIVYMNDNIHDGDYEFLYTDYAQGLYYFRVITGDESLDGSFLIVH